MGSNSVTQVTDNTFVQAKAQNNNENARMKKDFYEFFNYNDLEAWGGNQDLMDKYLYAAEKTDRHSPDGVMKKDGYLSKKEFEQFMSYIDKNDKSKFSNPQITDDENRMFRDDQLIPDSVEDSEIITDKDRKRLRKMSNATYASLGVTSVGGIGMALCGVAGGATATGTLGAITGLSVATGGVGFVALLITGGVLLAYRNHLENKAEKAQNGAGK